MGHDLTALGRFDLVRLLGRGGQGSVYLARDRRTDTEVAVKVLADTSPAGVMRFKEEFRVAQRIAHPNLVALDELLHEDGHWFFTMEIVLGDNFVEYCRPRGELNLARARSSLEQLTHAIDALHAEGVLHRDLKPSNIKVSSEGRLVVLDFGLASSESDEVDERHVAGTVEYMAPEQAASGRLSPATDWYGVGAVLYHALCGRPPFAGPATEIMLRKQTVDPPPPSAVVADVPADLDQLCRSLLARDPRRRPTPHPVLTRLESRARSTSLGARGTFVGREHELARLKAILEDGRREPRLALVVGPSGVGKTALVMAATERAVLERGAVVVAARCYPRESVASGGSEGLVEALAKALRRLPGELVSACAPRRTGLLTAAFPALRLVDAFADATRDDVEIADPFTRRSRALEAMRELLGRLTDRRPLVVTIDDIQWADAETLAFFESLLSPPDAPPLRLLATWRGEHTDAVPPSPFEAVERITIDTLDRASALRLAKELLEREGGPAVQADVDTLAMESGGHPLLLDVLIGRALQTSTHLRGRVSLRDALTARVAALDEVSRGVVDALAIAGAPVEESLLATVLQASPVAISRAISTLRAQRLVRGGREGDRLLAEVHHEQVRVCVAEILDEGRERALNRAFANALEAVGRVDYDRVLHYLLGAGEYAAAAKAAVRAGFQARQSFAFHRAAYFFAVALSHGGTALADRAGVRRSQADCLAAAGRGAEAAEHYLACAAETSGDEALELRRLAAQQLLVSGHTTDGLAALREVLDREGLVLPATSRAALLRIGWARLRIGLRRYRFSERPAADVRPRDLTRIDVCWHVGLGLSIVDTMRGQAFNALGVLLALRAGEPRRLGRALALELAYLGTRGGLPDARAQQLEGMVSRLVESTQDPQVLGLAIGCRGIAAFLRGDWREASRKCEDSEQVFRERCQGVPWELATAKLYAARARLALGEISGLFDRTERDIRDCRERGDLYGETSLRAAVVPFMHLVRGDLSSAEDEAVRALDRWKTEAYQLQHYFQSISRANVDLYRGDGAAALERLDHDAPALRRAMLLRVQHVRGSLLDLRARALLMSRGTKFEIEMITTKLERERMPWLAAHAAVLRAALAARAVDTPGEIRWLGSALDTFVACDMTMHAMAVRSRLGAIEGGDAGNSLRQSAAEWADKAGVRDLDALTRMLVPR